MISLKGYACVSSIHTEGSTFQEKAIDTALKIGDDFNIAGINSRA